MGMHDGHRQRLKNRFLAEGLESFEDHNVLELLLFYSIPRKDTNEIAHRLLNEFKSLKGVFDAPVEALCNVDGISIHTATLIKMMPAIFSKYEFDKAKETEILTDSRSYAKYFIPLFRGKTNEEFHVMLLDNKRKLIRCERAFEGTVNATQITMKRLVSMVINNNASAVVIAHNHPGGVALPSASDKDTTFKIFNALKMINVHLLDHIIVSDSDYMSFSDCGELERYKF